MRADWFAFCLVLVGCSADPRFRDTRKLEQPPLLQPVETGAATESFDPLVTLEQVQQGLGNRVRLESVNEHSVLTIDAPFAQSWFIVQITLQALGLEITDLNRQEGIYFVDFDPDQHPEEKWARRPSLFAGLAALFADDSYDLRNYRLKLRDSGRFTEVTAKYTPASLLEPEAEPKNAPALDQPEDGPERLLALLDRVLRQGLPKPKSDKKPAAPGHDSGNF